MTHPLRVGGRRRRFGVAAVLAVAVTGPVACGDGTPPFCDRLAEVRSLSGLRTALERGDLDTAAEEAEVLEQVADEAPPEIRDRVTGLADAVGDVVALLAADRGAGDSPDPAEVERRREELNDRLGELAPDASAVSAWASENCGIDLSAP